MIARSSCATCTTARWRCGGGVTGTIYRFRAGESTGVVLADARAMVASGQFVLGE